jgi:hypothetical protein
MKLNLQKLISETTGETLSEDFYMHHSKRIFVVVILLILYINLRYECEEAIYDIDSLKRELDDVRFTSIARWGELTGMNKPEIVRHRVEESNVHLTTSNEPAVTLDR